MLCNICEQEMEYLIRDLFFCPSCELISSNIPPDLTLYDKSYQRKYERYAQTEIGRKILEYRLSVIGDKKNLRVLDFGCGTGEFHKSLSNAIGFDINPYSDYNDISVLFRKYDIVTFWDSLEHLVNPKAVVKGLNPQYIFICTPCYDDFINSHPKENIIYWHHYYPEEHIHYFNEKALITLLNNCGYKIIFKDFGESRYRTSGKDKNIITVGGEKCLSNP